MGAVCPRDMSRVGVDGKHPLSSAGRAGANPDRDRIWHLFPRGARWDIVGARRTPPDEQVPRSLRWKTVRFLPFALLRVAWLIFAFGIARPMTEGERTLVILAWGICVGVGTVGMWTRTLWTQPGHPRLRGPGRPVRALPIKVGLGLIAVLVVGGALMMVELVRLRVASTAEHVATTAITAVLLTVVYVVFRRASSRS